MGRSLSSPTSTDSGERDHTSGASFSPTSSVASRDVSVKPEVSRTSILESVQTPGRLPEEFPPLPADHTPDEVADAV